MIVILRDDDMGEQVRPGAPAGDRTIGCQRRDDGVADPARQLTPGCAESHRRAQGRALRLDLRSGDKVMQIENDYDIQRAGADATSSTR
jgi:hypothetical protein